jgi:hypothetical protein
MRTPLLIAMVAAYPMAFYCAEAFQMNQTNGSNPMPKLECSFDLSPGKQLKVKAKVVNSGAKEIFVFNHLWTLKAGKPVADAEQVYRFVRNSELRLLWGIAPAPRLTTVTYRNIPFATPVSAGRTLEWEYSVALPAKEYSVYYQEEPKEGYKPQQAGRAVVLVHFVEAQPKLTTSPSGLGGAVKVSTPEAMDSHQTLTCSSQPMQIDVLLRTGDFSRIMVRDEKPEPLVLAK